MGRSERRPPLGLDEAVALLEAAIPQGPAASEVIPVAAARGRVLAEAPTARVDLPPFHKSAMDGFALAEGEDGEAFPVVGEVAAGAVPTGPVARGTAVRVMTGAPVPPGTGRVVPVEHVEVSPEGIRLRRPSPARNICARGEDLAAGAAVLPAGTRLAAVDLANLAAAGVGEVRVARPPRLAVLSTGDEVVGDPAALGPGRILDANGPLLEALAATWGLPVTCRAWLPDRLHETEVGLARALDASDLVILSGGVSEGDYDQVPAALRALGLDIRFDRLQVKPGRPATFATGPRGTVFALPGNPVPVYLMFHLLVLRAVARLEGGTWPVRVLRLPLANPLARRRAERREFRPAVVTPAGTVAEVVSHGTAHLLAASAAEGFLVLPEGVARVEAGEPVEVLLLTPPR